MNKFVELSKRIRNSEIADDRKLKSLKANIQTMETLEIYDKLVIILLQAGIECQCLINAGSDFKLGKIKEEDFRKFLFVTLV